MLLAVSTVTIEASAGRLCPCEQVVRRWWDRGNGRGSLIFRCLPNSQTCGGVCKSGIDGAWPAFIVGGTGGGVCGGPFTI